MIANVLHYSLLLFLIIIGSVIAGVLALIVLALIGKTLDAVAERLMTWSESRNG